MLKLFTQKKENLLIVGIVLLALLSYQLAFKKTIAAWQLNASLKAQLERSGDPDVQPGYLERKNANLERVLGLYRADTVAFRNQIINKVSLLADKENVKLTEVPFEQAEFHTEKFVMQKLVFRGDYFSLIRTLHQLRQAPQIGMIRSLALKLPTRQESAGSSLPLMEIYLLAAK